MKKYSKACVIGRFQPMHNGHVKMVKKALEVAETVYILVGSANKFPDVKNPFSYMDRCRMIDMVIKRDNDLFSQIHRIKIKPLNDSKYNDEKWKMDVRLCMEEKDQDTIAMVGFEKDQDSYWLTEFGWDHVKVQPYNVFWLGETIPMSSKLIRDYWLRCANISPEVVPNGVVDFLLKFSYNDKFEYTKEFNRLHEERLHWDKEIEKFKSYPYKGSLHHCCGDAVVICNNHVLLIERKFAPGKGAYALPGGHKDENETFRYAALRELEEEVGLKVPSKVIRGSIKDQHLFDDPTRTAEFCKPTVAQYIVLQPDHGGKLPRLQAGSDAKKAMWVPLHKVKQTPEMMFDDHYDIIVHFTGI